MGEGDNDFVRTNSLFGWPLELVHLRLARLRVGLRGASQLRCLSETGINPAVYAIDAVRDTRAVSDWH